MKIRVMENIAPGFTFPVDGKPEMYNGAPLTCGAEVDVDEKDAAPLLVAGVAESKEPEVETKKKGKG